MSSVVSLPERITGLLMLATALLLLGTDFATPVWEEWLTIALYGLMVTGALLITRAILAVALASACLALVHTDLSAPAMLPSVFYPAIVVVAASIAAVVITRRFRTRMSDTHGARWLARTSDTEAEKGSEETS